jgi:hypothetical protein
MESGGSGQLNGIIPEELPREYSTGEAALRSVGLVNESGSAVNAIVAGAPLNVLVRWEVMAPCDDVMIEIGLINADGLQITQSYSATPNSRGARMEPGWHEVRLSIADTIFPGRYSLLAGIHRTDGTTIDFIERVFDFEVINAEPGAPGHYPWSVRGFLRPEQRWGEITKLNAPGSE